MITFPVLFSFRVPRDLGSRSLESLQQSSSAPMASYENVHLGLISQLTAEGFDIGCVTRALLITRNDAAMARDILQEFTTKSSN